MKKQRGLKRYYKRLATENDLDRVKWLNLNDPNAWFDNWHLHFDWKGYGDTSFKRREPHLDKLFRHFYLLEQRINAFKKDFQLYAIILDYSSYDDALFLHTKNPNNNNFPWKSECEVSDKNNLTNADLKDYIDNLTGYKLHFGTAEENYCILTKDGIGLPVT
ncbi:MAG TPA: hypothetical protein DIW47_10270 [Bacteroidetes bacterium]|nr:hypothetical protein [Bacteroidota bacterium]